MKKLLSIALCGVIASALCLAACGDGVKAEENSVTLVGIQPTQIGVTDGIDYYVAAEPAASLRVKTIEHLDYAGDLQELYGGDVGYPQAVIVAKKDLIQNYSVVGEFLKAVEKSREWLLSDSVSIETIVNAVQSHLSDGLAPTFNATNLTKSVISNCGISFEYAADGKSGILNYMQVVNEVGESSFGTPQDAFFKTDKTYGSKAFEGTVEIYMPDGAPALGLANLLSGEETFNGNYHVVNAETIQTFVNGANPAADICVLPVTAAVKLLGSGEKYSLLGTLTHGNLYLLSNGGERITRENIKALAGKKVGVISIAQVPGLTFKAILKKNGINFNEAK